MSDPVTGRHDVGDPFIVYHRRGRRTAALRLVALAIATGVAVSGAWWLAPRFAEAAPAPTTALSPAMVPMVPQIAQEVPQRVAEQSPNTLPSIDLGSREASPADVATSKPHTPQSPARSFEIPVTATGYQTEIDQCQWVRMDIGAVAPIVGAHTSCGGEIVLDMQAGDRVFLTGNGVDGGYEVAMSRDAHAGDDAATATAGLSAVVILQSCYRDRDAVRLVGLLPLPPP
ncbi:hypothetical protein [Luethyella okanaganae]|uniref:Uncharacterized protein n=1 Tax=Luethyella okanaganae TaxID=69372 RepID=A0ABW1VCJ2_9MICO